MKIHSVLAAIALGCTTSLAFANHCPADMKAIDEAMSKQPSIAAAELDEAARLRTEGEAFHKAGKHKESMESLARARKILGI
jgi:hypothetical protein